MNGGDIGLVEAQRIFRSSHGTQFGTDTFRSSAAAASVKVTATIRSGGNQAVAYPVSQLLLNRVGFPEPAPAGMTVKDGIVIALPPPHPPQ